MNRIKLSMKLCLVSAMLLGCANTESGEFDRSKVAAEVNAVLDAQVLAWNRGEVDAYMDGYWQSDSLRFASGGSINYGWAPVLQRYKTRYSTAELMGQLEFTVIDITVFSANDAIVFGKWQLVRADDSPHGLFTLLFRRTEDGMRIVQDHTSSAQ